MCYLPNICTCTLRYHKYIIILFRTNVHYFLWDNMDKEFSSTSVLRPQEFFLNRTHCKKMVTSVCMWAHLTWLKMFCNFSNCEIPCIKRGSRVKMNAHALALTVMFIQKRQWREVGDLALCKTITVIWVGREREILLLKWEGNFDMKFCKTEWSLRNSQFVETSGC